MLLPLCVFKSRICCCSNTSVMDRKVPRWRWEKTFLASCIFTATSSRWFGLLGTPLLLSPIIIFASNSPPARCAYVVRQRFIFHVLALVICFGAGDGSLMYFSDIPSFFGSDHGKLSSYLPLFWFWSWQSTGPWSFSHFRWLPFFQLSFSPCLVFQTQTRRPWFTWRKVHSRPIFCCHWPWSSFRVCRWCTLGAWWWPSPWRKAGFTEESPSKRSALR